MKGRGAGREQGGAEARNHRDDRQLLDLVVGGGSAGAGADGVGCFPVERRPSARTRGLGFSEEGRVGVGLSCQTTIVELSFFECENFDTQECGGRRPRIWLLWRTGRRGVVVASVATATQG